MAHHLTLVTARHAHRAAAYEHVKRIGRWVRNTLVVIGLAFVALFVTFLVTGPHTPSQPTSTTTYAPIEIPAQSEWTTIEWVSGDERFSGTMDTLPNGEIRVTGDCIPKDTDFFWPCADITLLDGTDYRS